MRRFSGYNSVASVGRSCLLPPPHTFNEKLQWLKIYDHNPLYTTLVDKYEVKKYVSSIIGDEYIIPTLGVWDNVEEIDWESLPDQFVLKCTHDSGSIVVCKDKKHFDKTAAIIKLSAALKQNFYYSSREWPYKNVKPRILAEKYLEDNSGALSDYKFFCFNGNAKIFKIDFDRFKAHGANYYDISGNFIDLSEVDVPSNPSKNLKIPQNLSVMVDMANKLAEGIPFVRVDFYDINGNIYFGEMTFYPAGGMGKLMPDEWNDILGQWIKLP